MMIHTVNRSCSIA